jgi:hypothetical protein
MTHVYRSLNRLNMAVWLACKCNHHVSPYFQWRFTLHLRETTVSKVAHEGDLIAVPAILELLEHQDGRIRLAAVEALGCLGG